MYFLLQITISESQFPHCVMLWDLSRPRCLSGGDPEGFCPWETPLPCCPGPSRHTASYVGAPMHPWLPWVSTAPGASLLLTAPSLPSQSHCHGPGCILHVPSLASGPSLGPTPLNPTTTLHKTLSSPCRIPTSNPLDPLCSSRWPPLCRSLVEALGSQCLSILRSFHAKEEVPSSDDDSSEKCQGRAVGSWRRCIKPGLGVSQGGFSEEGTDRRLRPSLSSDSYLTVPVLRSSKPLPLPPCAPIHISRDLFPTHLLSLFQHASSYFDIRRTYFWLQNMTLRYIMSCRHLKNSKCRERVSLNPPICLKTDPPLDELS